MSEFPTARHVVLGLEIVDAVTAHLGPAWTHAEIDAELRDGALRVVSITRRDAPEAAPPEWVAFTTQLGIDAARNATDLARALTELRAFLAAKRMAWSGTRVRCERDEGGAQLELAEPDATTSARVTIGVADYPFRILTRELHAAVLAATAWLAQRGPGVLPAREAGAGFQGARYDGATSELELVFRGRSTRVPVEVLGSYSHEEGSWCWAWANETYAPERVARGRALADATPRDAGLGALFRPGFRCHSTLAGAVAAVAAARLDARDTFQLAYGPPTLEVYFVVVR